MTFNANIPNPNDRFPQSQPDILINFQQIDAIFGNNHVTLTAAEDNGKHNFCQFPEQGAAPATAVNEGALYTATGGSGGADLQFRRESNGAVLEMTGLTVANVGTNYGITTPWGQIMNWGSVLGAAGTVLVTFAVPFVGAPQSITLSPQVGAITSALAGVDSGTPPTNTQMLIRGPVGATVYYFAIGV